MIYRVDVSPRPDFPDARGAELRRQAEIMGIRGITGVNVSDLYFLAGTLSEAQVIALVTDLLQDPVTEQATWRVLGTPEADASALAGTRSIEVVLLPGVTDSVAESLLEGARIIGAGGLEQAATGRRYLLTGHIAENDVRRIAEGLLANTVIQSYTVDGPVSPPFVVPSPADDSVETIPLDTADDAALKAISRARRLSLDLAEMRAIRAYYRSEGRQPSDVELETLAQTWSEHCIHKTFRALIDYEERLPDGQPAVGSARQIDSLLNTFIRAATEQVAKPYVHSAFVDNAGIVAFDDRFDLAFKVETHNHPSALEPFGGANTGVGGVIRDIIGVSARPIANTDVLCFGLPDLPLSGVPAGVLHPRRIAGGVTAGIEDYGNKMGIPTVNGAILYGPGYTANPLVFCGCLGLLPRGAHRSSPAVGDLVVVIGGRTGRDGLRGATFSSMEMDHETGYIAGSAVQIGHPIHEKQALEAVMVARDEGLYTAITDCGAGGLSSAVGEMAAQLGAEIHLDRVPLKYTGLRPWEIWLSEAQERMVLAVPPSSWGRVQEICHGLDVEATVLGHFTGDGRLTLLHSGRVVGRLATDFLHHGIPRRHLRAVWRRPAWSEGGHTGPPQREALSGREIALADLLALLATPDIRSKEDIVRRYDHEVQGATTVKPFVGPGSTGPADAAVLNLQFAIQEGKKGEHEGPLLQKGEHGGPPLQRRGVALACGINPAYGELDPYAMAWAAVDEAIRNCVAVGADPDQVSLLDNFCWGNPNLPDRLGGLVRCAQGCYEAAVAYGAPFVSGKDSLNNEYTTPDGGRHAIPGTLLISALAIVPDVARTVTMDLKASGDRLYLVGNTADEMGGSAYHRLHGWTGGLAPQPPAQGLETYRALHQAMLEGLVRACHDCSEGGLAVAAAEMALAGGLGADLLLQDMPRPSGLDRDEAVAFGESLGRLLVEVSPEDTEAFEWLLVGLPHAQVGSVRPDDRFIVTGCYGRPALETRLDALETAWRGHLR